MQAIPQAIVTVPVADVRSQPSLPSADALALSDKMEETQALMGERLWVHASSGDWVSVEALDQPSFKSHQRWEGYRGWILKSSLKKVAEFPALNKVVAVPWAGVTRQPGGALLESLPMGSRVRVLSRWSAWSLISLLDGRQGWVYTDALQPWPAAPAAPTALRQKILNTAQLFIGDPYRWGGLTHHDSTLHVRPTGVDCSGLVHLSYRVNGLRIPRDAQEQYLKAAKIERRQLKPADLIFSAEAKDPQKITHVMLYAGGDSVIEAPQSGVLVRMISFKDKTGVPLSAVETGQTLQDRVIYFGRLIGTQTKGNRGHPSVHPS
jgi:hypothetical protein